jgi:DNA (cytosine-5)-methyltransferase 1
VNVLDLFCCQGGAARGYLDAGATRVVGVDLAQRHARHYPGEFVHGDALAYVAEHAGDFDLVHASPPCQGYSRATAGNPAAREKHQRLIGATRDTLDALGVPYIIENVEQAAEQMLDPLLLCGRMFGLSAVDEDGTALVLDRHRLFESNLPLAQPDHPPHAADTRAVAGVYGGSRRAKRREGETLAQVAPRDRHAAKHERGGGYVPRSHDVQRALLGVDWMTVEGRAQALPPVYTAYLLDQVREVLA